MRDGEFNDPRLVEVYDAECTWGRDDDFFVSVANAAPRASHHARVLDLGCGTGRLTVALARAGHLVTGIDPAQASIDAARAKPGADRVTWIVGTSADAAEQSFDIALMTSHVAQFLLSDADWAQVLRDLAHALVPGGTLVFDTRDPADRRWERWNPVDSAREAALADSDAVKIHTEVGEIESTTGVGCILAFVHRYRFPDGTLSTSEAALRFRTEAEVRTSLGDAGFSVDQIYGGWERQPIGHSDGEFLVVARRR